MPLPSVYLSRLEGASHGDRDKKRITGPLPTDRGATAARRAVAPTGGGVSRIPPRGRSRPPAPPDRDRQSLYALVPGGPGHGRRAAALRAAVLGLLEPVPGGRAVARDQRPDAPAGAVGQGNPHE